MKKFYKRLSCLILTALTTGLFANNGYTVIAAAKAKVESINFDAKDVPADLKTFNVSPIYDPDSNKLLLPRLEGYNIEIFGSDRKEVIALDGTVTKPINDVNVKLLYKITNKSDNTAITTEVNAVVKIPARKTEVIGDNKKPEVVPSLREWVGGTGDFVLNDNSRIVYNSDDMEQTARAFQTDLLDLTGRNLKIVKGVEEDLKSGDIYLSLEDSEPALSTEGYYLEIGGADGTKEYTVVRAFDKVGILYGTISIMQILKLDEGRDNLPKGIARDYPKFEKRGMMLDVARKFIPIEYLNDLIKQMSWYKLNMLSTHLSDNDIWNSLSTDGGTEPEGWFRLESEMYPTLAAEEHYTKNEFRKLQYDALDAGITIIPEFDSPGHALPLTELWPELQLGNNKKYLDVTNPQSVKKVSQLFDEYILGTNLEGEEVYEPTFIGPIVNIGTDEYKADHSMKNDFRKYTDELLRHINSTGKQALFWGSLKENAGDYQVTTDAIMFAWYQGYADAKKSLDEGYKIISMEDLETYIVPGGGYYSNQFGRPEYLYNSWLPNKNSGWAGKAAPEGHPGVLGGQFAVWNDFVGNGISVNDISYRIKDNLYAIAEKSWGGDERKDSGFTYSDLNKIANNLGDAPNADFLYEIDNKVVDNELVELDDKVTNLTEGNTGANIISSVNISENVAGKNENAIRFNGGESYIATDIKSPGFDWTASMWLNPEIDNPENSILMEGKTGTIRLENGKIKYDVEQYTHVFDYKINNNEWSHIALTGTYEGVKLYVNGEFIDELKDKPYPNYNFNSGNNSWDGGFYPTVDGKKTTRYFETLMLPMEYIGSRTNSFKGSIDELKIYDRVLSANEIASLSGLESTEKKNVALNKNVVSSNPVNVGGLAINAVDGDNLTRWEFAQGENNYIIDIPLNEGEDVNKIVINQRVWNPYTTRIENLKVEAVTGETKEIIYDGSCDANEFIETINGNSQIKGTTINLSSTYTADKIRFTFIAKATGPDDLVNIAEIEMYGSVELEEELEGDSEYKLVPHSSMSCFASDANSLAAGIEGPASLAIDDKPNTWWHTTYGANKLDLPQSITLDLNGVKNIGKYEYLPRPNTGNGTITSYEIQVSLDNINYFTVKKGQWALDSTLKVEEFESVPAAYVRLVAYEGKGNFASAAELNVYEKNSDNDIKFYLNSLIEICDTLNKDNYVTDTFDSLQDILAHSKVVKDKVNATKEEVDAAYMALLEAYGKLEVKGDKEQLREFYNENKDIENINYTIKSYNYYKKILQEVNNILNGTDDISKVLIDEAKVRLQEAVNALVDTSVLKETIDKAEAIDLNGYTEETVNNLKNRVEEAKLLIISENSTLYDIKKAEYDILDLIDALEEKVLPTTDINNDGVVNIKDLGIVSKHYGQSKPECDVDGNGIVDQADIDLIIKDILAKY